MQVHEVPYDPFGDDRMIYTIKNVVTENEKLLYNDGIRKIFLYTKGSKDGNLKLKNLLDYMENTRKEKTVEKKGVERGEELKLIELVCRKIAKRKELSLIAEELEDDESTIKKIYDAAMEYAPDFDVAKIYDLLHGK